jgi:hypothetical protein
MTVKIESCFFEENQYSYAVIATISGTATLTSALFRDNGTSRLGSIGATSTSEIQIETSCFIKNTALLYGVVMIDATSKIKLMSRTLPMRMLQFLETVRLFLTMSRAHTLSTAIAKAIVCHSLPTHASLL